MSTDLKHLHYVTHQEMSRPIDVNIHSNKLYILFSRDNPCLHEFSLNGDKLRSLLLCDRGGRAKVRGCLSFCLDPKQNILMADYEDNHIKVFSQRGELLHTIGDTLKPQGIYLASNNMIICSYVGTNFGLHIFK